MTHPVVLMVIIAVASASSCCWYFPRSYAKPDRLRAARTPVKLPIYTQVLLSPALVISKYNSIAVVIAVVIFGIRHYIRTPKRQITSLFPLNAPILKNITMKMAVACFPERSLH